MMFERMIFVLIFVMIGLSGVDFNDYRMKH